MHIAIDNLSIIITLWIIQSMMQPTVGNLVGYIYMTVLTSCWDLHGNDQTVLGVDHGLYRPLTETRAI